MGLEPAAAQADGDALNYTGCEVDKAERRSDFFIVGAPKSGTTALHHYLHQHPEVFVAEKELHYFGSDLPSARPRCTPERYAAAFSGVRDEKRVGETSVGYLYSKRAAGEIRAYAPNAQIIAMLRTPVDAIHSLHSYCLYDGSEDIRDLAEALAAEPDRLAGRRIPRGASNPWNLHYRSVFRYAEQLMRYLDAFGPERVHVIVFDDFERDPAAAYRGVLEFLGVRADFSPEFTVFNPARAARSRMVSRIVNHPPPWISRLGRMVGQRSRRWLSRRIREANTVAAKSSAMPVVLRKQLESEFAPELRALEALLGRDLSAWREAGSAAERAGTG